MTAPPPSARHERRHLDGQSLNVGADDQRERFEIDRDRILYSSAFRRLGGVTQVVGSGEGQLFHNRLTHSTKAAQIGRRLAQRLLRHDPALQEHLDPEVVEAAALAHDLGHPPFGHAGETELDRLVASAGPGETDGFEGNAQTFRILTKLACHRVQYQGLDLTRAALRAVIKYPWLRDDPRADRPGGGKKWNAYKSESDDFAFALQGEESKSLEATLMEYADDIAYSVHDVEDFHRAGWIPLDRLASDLSERRRFLDLSDKQRAKHGLDRHDAEGAAGFVLSLYQNPRPYQGGREERAHIRTLTSKLIGRYVRAVSVTWADGRPVAEMDKHESDEIALLKCLCSFYVFSNPGLTTQQHGHRKIIRRLFGAFSGALRESPDGPAPTVLPASAREFWEHARQSCGSDDEVEQLATRVAADGVASLTEQEAIGLYQRLNGYDVRSVRERLVY